MYKRQLYVYAYYLSPFLEAHERDIDKAVSTANGWSLDLVATILQTIANTLRTQLALFLAPAVRATPDPMQGVSVPPSQHNPAQGVITQAGSALQAGAPVAMGIGAAVVNWISAAAQQASEASDESFDQRNAGGYMSHNMSSASSRNVSGSTSRNVSGSTSRNISVSSPRSNAQSRQTSVSSPPLSPRTPQTEVLRTRRVFSPNPLDDAGDL